jgi:hypothetical protein
MFFGVLDKIDGRSNETAEKYLAVVRADIAARASPQ